MQLLLHQARKKTGYFLTIFLVLLISQVYAQTINIATAADLAKIGKDPNYPLSGNYVQTADISLSAYANWTPIDEFTGSYNGQYHTISDLTIAGSGKSYQGLFEQISSSGSVKNLKFVNVNINLEGDARNVGTLVGRCRGKISRVAVLSGNVKAYYYVGGLVGTLLQSGGIMSECHSHAVIEGNSYVETYSFPDGTGGMIQVTNPSADIGGLIGVIQNGASLTDSYATGSVAGYENVGGLIGYNTANGSVFTKSYASGAVSAASGDDGGLVGLNGGDGSENYWNVNTTGQNTAAWHNSNLGTGKTDAQMKQQATFITWDFTNVWEMVEGVSQPRLRWLTISTLPVLLSNFDILKQAGGVKLLWQTVAEHDNGEFVIYKSGDGKQFERLTQIASAGNSNTVKNYAFFDQQPLMGNNYYKLIQIDHDGKETELGVKVVNFPLSAIGIQIYPNPTVDMVKISFGENGYTTLMVTDINGKIVERRSIQSGQSSVEVSLNNRPSGTYLLHLNGPDGRFTEKILKK